MICSCSFHEKNPNMHCSCKWKKKNIFYRDKEQEKMIIEESVNVEELIDMAKGKKCLYLDADGNSYKYSFAMNPDEKEEA